MIEKFKKNQGIGKIINRIYSLFHFIFLNFKFQRKPTWKQCNLNKCNKQCLTDEFNVIQLDYIPTSLVKSCAETFSILISHLANLSFTQATFPSKFKLALISPLLKKPGLPKSELSNFRPISNLNTIGKMLERLALARLFPHISVSPSFCPLQSTYRKFHSALLKLTNDIMETIDSGKITILTALDMSAAEICTGRILSARPGP